MLDKPCPFCNGTGRLRIPVGERMRAIREDRGMTQGQVADLLGCSRPALINMETGKQTVTIDKLIAFAKCMDVTADHLLGL